MLSFTKEMESSKCYIIFKYFLWCPLGVPHRSCGVRKSGTSFAPTELGPLQGQGHLGTSLAVLAGIGKPVTPGPFKAGCLFVFGRAGTTRSGEPDRDRERAAGGHDRSDQLSAISGQLRRKHFSENSLIRHGKGGNVGVPRLRAYQQCCCNRFSGAPLGMTDENDLLNPKLASVAKSGLTGAKAQQRTKSLRGPKRAALLRKPARVGRKNRGRRNMALSRCTIW